MSKTGRNNHRRADREAKRRKTFNNTDRKITVRSDKRTPPDLHKLSRAVIAIALAEMNTADRDSSPGTSDQEAATNNTRQGGRR